MYNRLFTKILDSSIWLEPLATRVVWITLLAAMDEDGVATFACAENLARRAGVTSAECESALICLLGPDANSSDPENEGRRVERIAGGYIVLNAEKYRAIFSREIHREQTRRRVAKHRGKSNAPVTLSNAPVTECNTIRGRCRGIAEEEEQHVCTSVVRPARASNGTAPTDLHARILEAKVELTEMFGRNSKSPWSYEEEHALSDALQRPEFDEELETLKAMKRDRPKFFPRSLTKLVTNWTTILDQARTPTDPKAKPVDHNLEAIKRL